ncbi:membrane-associated progesterone receptor component 1-like [Panonychus citri]|uniref:membrane-associated progesterone receptor component 1-like n=1 Tax=Panonychus citri TaxID=50023 RepID=UPI002307F14D|nr:membrane-associated progesterone receptor component 1-like [Panonychus citri]
METSNDGTLNTEKGILSILNSLQETFLSSPFNIFLTVICAFLIYRLWRSSSPQDSVDRNAIRLPEPLKKHDMDLEELKRYDGKGADGRVCIAINGVVFDCSKSHFYQPGGPYQSFAGRDATRGLAKFDVTAVSDEWDDHVDLTPSEISSVQEWEMQFRERYEIVGKLVKDLTIVTEKKDDIKEKSEEETNDEKKGKKVIEDVKLSQEKSTSSSSSSTSQQEKQAEEQETSES